MNQPILSITMPIFNRKDLVVEMVESIINQVFRDWELIMVDDGSNQETVDALNMLCQKDSRIRLIQRMRNPKGAQTCRNIGFEESKGKYVIFFDSDDLLPDYCLGQRVQYMEKHPDLDFAVFPYVSFTNTIGDKPFKMCGAVETTQNDLAKFIVGSIPFVVWNIIYKKDSLIQKGRNWDINILSLQDADFNIQCILSGMKYDYAKDARIDYYFRIGGGVSHISKAIKTPQHAASHLYFTEKQLSSLTQQWRNRNRNAVKWCFVHKFYFAASDEDNQFLDNLLNLSKKFNCYNYLYIKIHLFRFLTKRLRFSQKLAKYIIFPQYSISTKNDRKKRSSIIKSIM